MAARYIMVQGVGADSGKSLISGGLCRLLANKGYRVAPFKSVLFCRDADASTPRLVDERFNFLLEGARCQRDPAMNPIQVTPGRLDWIGNWLDFGWLYSSEHHRIAVPLFAKDALNYHAFAPSLLQKLRALTEVSLDKVARNCDVVVIEGSGNAVDLGVNDLPNYLVSQMVPVRTLLVSKLSAGGAAASLLGTVEMMEAELRQTVCGYIVNDVINSEVELTFLDTLTRKTGVPFLGAIPNHSLIASWKTRDEELNSLAEILEDKLNLDFLDC